MRKQEEKGLNMPNRPERQNGHWKWRRSGRRAGILAVVGCAFLLSACARGENRSHKSEGFEPRLDTKEAQTLEIAGFVANFEALDQAVVAFNEIYPNVTVLYEQNGSRMLADYMKNSQNIDIFMTADANVRNPETEENDVAAYCEDLSKLDINFDSMIPEMLSYCMVDGKLLRLPIMQNPCGMAENKTLLEKNGLFMPKNYPDFLDTLENLKQGGYLPIQGAENHVYAELGVNRMMDLLAEDRDLLAELKAGESSAVEKVEPVFEQIQTMIENGYTDYEKNKTYPSDNYDASILGFFEGKMPFWVCTAESFSGAKKRESKSEHFKSEPFEYEFEYVPFGENGVYAYTEPWYGFSISKNSDSKEYAEEFLRFLVETSELDRMASIKGMPSVQKNGKNERYPAIFGKTKSQEIESEFVSDGSVDPYIRPIFTKVATDLGAGVYVNAKEASEAFVQACKQ